VIATETGAVFVAKPGTGAGASTSAGTWGEYFRWNVGRVLPLERGASTAAGTGAGPGVEKRAAELGLHQCCI